MFDEDFRWDSFASGSCDTEADGRSVVVALPRLHHDMILGWERLDSLKFLDFFGGTAADVAGAFASDVVVSDSCAGEIGVIRIDDVAIDAFETFEMDETLIFPGTGSDLLDNASGKTVCEGGAGPAAMTVFDGFGALNGVCIPVSGTKSDAFEAVKASAGPDAVTVFDGTGVLSGIFLSVPRVVNDFFLATEASARVGALFTGKDVVACAGCLVPETAFDTDDIGVINDVCETEALAFAVFDDRGPTVDDAKDWIGLIFVTGVGAPLLVDKGLAFTGTDGVTCTDTGSAS